MRMSTLLLCAGIVLAVFTAGSLAKPHADFEEYQLPRPTWVDKESIVSTNNRKLSAIPTCRIKITGTGALYGLKSAEISCSPGTTTFFAGRPLVNYFNSNPSKFSGVKLQLPNEPNFLGTNNQEPCLFLTGRGRISLTGYVRNLSLKDWAGIVIEQGTDASLYNFDFSGNKGQRFASLAVSRSTVLIKTSTFTKNTCTLKNRCHTGALYVTEGARVTVNNTVFKDNKGHLAGALMITSGALGTITYSNFSSNSVINYGDFGGAVFHDFCTDPRTNGGKSQFRNNKFFENSSKGFGGAIKIGSPDGGCAPTIADNRFSYNKAELTGGAIFFTYCAGKQPYILRNTFVSNSAGTFNGQIGYNPTTYPSKQGSGKTPAKAGCLKPVAQSCTFSGSAPKYSSPWYFP